MNYTIDDLKAEFENWFEQMSSDMQMVLKPVSSANEVQYELVQPDRDKLNILEVEIPLYYRLVSEGEWPYEHKNLHFHINGLSHISFYRQNITTHRFPHHIHLTACVDARNSLVNGGVLDFSELAVLAQVDERTVRNAASAKKLETIKSGGSTYIKPDEAERWLAGRRGYKPTIFPKPLAVTIFDLINEVAKERGTSRTQLLENCGLGSARALVHSEVKGSMDSDLTVRELHALAQELDVDVMRLIDIGLKNSRRTKKSPVGISRGRT